MGSLGSRMLLLALLAACNPDTSDINVGDPAPCDEGFARDDAGNCVEVTEGDADTDTDTDTDEPVVDMDDDGAAAELDCDDNDATRYPGAPEIVADGIDQDCDTVDACYMDADADGHGTDQVVSGASLDCAAGPGAAFADDCDDTAPTVYPGAADDTDDTLDNDCDGTVDEDWDACGAQDGRLTLAAEEHRFTREGGAAFEVTGTGTICTVGCDAAWLEVEVQDRDDVVPLPFELEEYGKVVVRAEDPGTGTGTTGLCEVYTSDGTWTLTLEWGGE